jgi:hypothetical protein
MKAAAKASAADRLVTRDRISESPKMSKGGKYGALPGATLHDDIDCDTADAAAGATSAAAAGAAVGDDAAATDSTRL